MKNHRAQRCSTAKTRALFPQFLFILSALLCVYTTYHVTGTILDSDASSELILAKHLSDTRQWLTRDFYYPSELRVFHMNLVYTPLFFFLNDWHMIRFLGALILQAGMIFSYAFLFREAGLSKRVFYYSTSLILLPVSVCHGRIVLYHCHYIPHVILSCLTLGLLLGFSKDFNWRRKRPYIRLFLLLAVSFCGSLNGIRQIMVTYAPALLAIFCLCFAEDFHDNHGSQAALLSKKHRSLLLCTLAATAAAFAGYIFHLKVLGNHYSFIRHSGGQIKWMTPDNLDNILYSILHQFGYRQEVPLVSLMGILSFAGIFAGLFCFVLSLIKLFHHTKEMDIRQSFMNVFALSYMVVTIFLLTGTDSTELSSYGRYLVLCLVWTAPMLMVHLESLPRQLPVLHAKKLLTGLTVLILVGNGLLNTAYFMDYTKYDQFYEGIGFEPVDKVESLSGVVEFLTEEGYTWGYATYWESNIVTEITDGQIQTVIVARDDDNGNIYYHNMLTHKWLREEVSEKAFLIIPIVFKETFEISDSYPLCTSVYEDSRYVVYNVDQSQEFITLLYS